MNILHVFSSVFNSQALYRFKYPFTIFHFIIRYSLFVIHYSLFIIYYCPFHPSYNNKHIGHTEFHYSTWMDTMFC